MTLSIWTYTKIVAVSLCLGLLGGSPFFYLSYEIRKMNDQFKYDYYMIGKQKEWNNILMGGIK